MTRALPALALIAAIGLVAGACTRPFTSAPPAKIMDVYAASPSAADARSLLGGEWWTAAPTFAVRPLDDANFATQVQYTVVRRYVNVGTSESWRIRYIQFDKSSSASSLMSNIENSLGSGNSGKNAGDKTLFYQEKLSSTSQGGAPYETLTLIRVGSLVVESMWLKNDGFPSSDQLGKIATKLADGVKNAAAGKVHGTAVSADELALLPPPNAYITLLGAVKLPIEAIPLMINFSAPTQLVALLKDVQLNDFVFGDYVLDNDTHMEVQAAVFTLTSSTAANELFDTFKGSASVDANGVLKFYNDVTGPGQYDYYIVSGRHVGLLICRSTAELSANESASRACESPLETVAAAWPTAFRD
ncbi:MAG TPA: hypothetical protein VGA47_02685 [Candidatus Dormibacteraeota bacterium]